MTTFTLPFQLDFDPHALGEFPASKTIIRRLSDMSAYYQDKAKVAEILNAEDPTIYRFWEIEQENAPRGLSFGVTCIYAGSIGREFHMTKGHFHTSPGDELYITLSGRGKLAMFSREGDVKTLDMLPGSMCYIPTAYAHRTINTGADEFIFLAVWPPSIAHDYETILKGGFPQLVVKGEQEAVQIIENPSHQRV